MVAALCRGQILCSNEKTPCAIRAIRGCAHCALQSENQSSFPSPLKKAYSGSRGGHLPFDSARKNITQKARGWLASSQVCGVIGLAFLFSQLWNEYCN